MSEAVSAKSARPDVAVFIPSFAGGGAERVAFFVARALSDAGLRVELVAACGHGALADEPLPGVTKVSLNVVTEFLAAPAWIRYLKRARPRCAISMVRTANLSSAIGAHFVPEVPIILSLHLAIRAQPEAQWWFRRRFGLAPERFLYRRVAHVLGVSHGLAEEASSAFDIPSHKVSAILNPREPRDAFADIGPEHESFFEKPVILGVGRLSSQKNFPMMLRAFARIAERRDLHLVILGEGPDRAALEAQARELGIADRVFFPGFVDSPPAYMRRARIFALSSYNEGFPMVLIEALQTGTAIVSTDSHFGPRELLRDGDFGRLTPVGDEERFAQALEAELDAKDVGPDCRRAEREAWLSRLDPDVIAAEYLALVRSIMAD
jgi:glycosyltransferase involved in cell wall biosynthesis